MTNIARLCSENSFPSGLDATKPIDDRFDAFVTPLTLILIVQHMSPGVQGGGTTSCCLTILYQDQGVYNVTNHLHQNRDPRCRDEQTTPHEFDKATLRCALLSALHIFTAQPIISCIDDVMRHSRLKMQWEVAKTAFGFGRKQSMFRSF